MSALSCLKTCGESTMGQSLLSALDLMHRYLHYSQPVDIEKAILLNDDPLGLASV